MRVAKTDFFDSIDGSIENTVFVVKCDPHRDDRGCFTETYKSGDIEGKFANLDWCKQVNCSASNPFVFRGFHAQVGKNCQGKMVECVLGSIIDIIIDIRPNSNTFGKYLAFNLKATNHEKLWVPRGFLHGFFSDETPLFAVGKRADGGYIMQNAQNMFSYMVDAPYCKESEVTINPRSVFAFIKPNNGMDDMLAKVKYAAEQNKIIFSQKDESGMDFRQCLSVLMTDYKNTGLLWYQDNEETKLEREEEVADEDFKSEKTESSQEDSDVPKDDGIERIDLSETCENSILTKRERTETTPDGGTYETDSSKRETRAVLPELPPPSV